MEKEIIIAVMRVANLFFKGLAVCFIMVTLFFDYASASLIRRIDPEVLKNTTSYIILDARPKKIWQSGHIPDAISLNWEDHTIVDEKKIPYRIPPVDKLALKLGSLGINETNQVVVYGDADSTWGGEGWVCWLLTYLGHKGDICLLSGGISAWSKRGYPIDQSIKKYDPVIYKPRINNDVIITTQTLKASMKSIQLVDTRSTLEWFRGSIPGAVHINWKKFVKGRDKKAINAAELKKMLEKNNIDPAKPVVYFCTGGVRSAYAWVVHDLAGFPSSRNYEEGLEAWKQQK